MKRYSFILLMYLFCQSVAAMPIDSLRLLMLNQHQVQEKVYIHTDNKCYFVGDTLWYKAYVLRADNHHFTDLSRILYVELLSPDGLVVERQKVIVDGNGYSNGQFALKDSLYSGYYELRAYTRWMLNFNVFEHKYDRFDTWRFYNKQMAADFFRDWNGLFSRVFPVYSKPQEPGDYDTRYMYGRPRREVPPTPKNDLNVSFYPEGGSLVTGLKSRIAFEITDEYGQAVECEGTLSDGTILRSGYMGRGVIEIVPNDKSEKVSFKWKDKEYSFKLPSALKSGVVIDASQLTQSGRVTLRNSPNMTGDSVVVMTLCRGQLQNFIPLKLNGEQECKIPLEQMSTGVSEVMVVNNEGNVLASRLVFINHHDAEEPIIVSIGDKTDFEPYEPVLLQAHTNARHFSISVYDGGTSEDTYDTGNIMTDMLLTSDLKGFIASPDYYFESEDEEHQRNLELLMMVQGWRRYRPVSTLRYTPEKSFMIEGTVYKQLDVKLPGQDDISTLTTQARNGGMLNPNEPLKQSIGGLSTEGGVVEEQTDYTENQELMSGSEHPIVEIAHEGSFMGVNHGNLKHEVLVEGEVTIDNLNYGGVQLTTNNGHFIFEIPPFYGMTILFLKAYEEKDSVKKSLSSHVEKKFMDETAYPDFYVKRDLFYPVFAHPYNWYQTHQPDIRISQEGVDTISMTGDHVLETVEARTRRRGRRAIDYSKPAFVMDAYDIYNLTTDRGLSWGVVNMWSLPSAAAYAIYANLNSNRNVNIRGRLDDYTFYYNYNEQNPAPSTRSDAWLESRMHLNRIQNLRFYTDYEPRKIDTLLTRNLGIDDITIVYETVANDGKRFTYRDRRYRFNGLAFPEDFYSPNYSKRQPDTPTDYRRTLYWNPNAMTNERGNFSTIFYNNSKETRLRISAAGVTEDGRFVYNE